MIMGWMQQVPWTKPPAGQENTAVRSSVPQTPQAAAVAQTTPEAAMPKTPTTPFIDPQKVQQMEPDIAAIRQTVEQHLAAVRETVDQLAAAGATAAVEGADTILANSTIKLKIAEASSLMHRGIDLVR